MITEMLRSTEVAHLCPILFIHLLGKPISSLLPSQIQIKRVKIFRVSSQATVTAALCLYRTYNFQFDSSEHIEIFSLKFLKFFQSRYFAFKYDQFNELFDYFNLYSFFARLFLESNPKNMLRHKATHRK